MPIAYGFLDLEHLFARRVTEVGVDVITRAIDLTLEEHNRVLNALLEELASRTTAASRSASASPGRPNCSRSTNGAFRGPTQEYLYIEAGYPIFHAGDAIGRNRIARSMMTVQELNDEILRIQAEDARWVRRQSAGRVARQPAVHLHGPAVRQRHGAPAGERRHADYPLRRRRLGRRTITISRSRRSRTQLEPLPHHIPGARRAPGEPLPYVCLIANNLRDAVESLASFVPMDDPDIQRAATQAEVSARFPTQLVDEPLGKVGGLWVGVLALAAR
jgi:hypothetical protein